MNKKILRLAVPNIISNLSVPLLSSVDTAVVGHLDNIAHLGAIALGGMIFNFIYWGFGFLRMGTTGLTAQAYGGRGKKEITLVLFRALSVAMVSSAILILFQQLINNISFDLLHASDEVEHYASQYFLIRIFAAPATLALYAFHGWFLGMQNAKYPLILSVVVNILNIGFNLLFIYQFGMKSDGVALGTVIAQYCGLVLAIVLFLKKYSEYKLSFKLNEILHIEEFKKFFKLNFDIFLRTLALIFTLGFFTAKSAEFGDDILAANTILLQLWNILSYAVDGFAFAGESLVGFYIGERNSEQLKRAVKIIFIWGLGFGAAVSFVYLFFGEQIISLFTDKQNIVSIALIYITWTIISSFVNSVCFIWDGVYIGATATKAMRNTMLFSALIIFLPAFYFTKGFLGNHSLWLALFLFMIARGITLSIYAKREIYGKVSAG